jgi:hypothetical protein
VQALSYSHVPDRSGIEGSGPGSKCVCIVGESNMRLAPPDHPFQASNQPRHNCNIMVETVEFTVSKRLVGATRPCMSQLLYHCFINFESFYIF